MSPTHSIETTGIVLAILGTGWAAHHDRRTLRIPNHLTIPLILLGVVLCLVRVYLGEPWWWLLSLGLLAYLFVYVAWRLGAWGGGDAKLVLGITFLLPTIGGEPVLPVLLAVVAVLALIRTITIDGLSSERRLRPMAPLILLGLLVTVVILWLTPFP